MTSAIDPTKPVSGNPTTESVRDNFAAAKSEIEALQGSSGTWTPDLTFTTPGDLAVTYTNNAGTWTRHGTRINWTAFIQTATFTHSTASGSLVIAGLPVAVKNTANYYESGAGTFSSGTVTGFHDTTFRTDHNSDIIRIVGLSSTNGYGAANTTQAPTGVNILIIASGSYETE